MEEHKESRNRANKHGNVAFKPVVLGEDCHLERKIKLDPYL